MNSLYKLSFLNTRICFLILNNFKKKRKNWINLFFGKNVAFIGFYWYVLRLLCFCFISHHLIYHEMPGSWRSRFYFVCAYQILPYFSSQNFHFIFQPFSHEIFLIEMSYDPKFCIRFFISRTWLRRHWKEWNIHEKSSIFCNI